MRTSSFFILLLLVLLACAGCTSIDTNVRKVPGFEFKSWSHSDRYGVFTDNVVLSGAKWSINSDGSATLVLDHYDGSAAWAGMVGPHDAIEGLVVVFPARSLQAQTLTSGKIPKTP